MLQLHSRRAVTAVQPSTCDSSGWRQGGAIGVVGCKLGQVDSASTTIGVLLGA